MLELKLIFKDLIPRGAEVGSMNNLGIAYFGRYLNVYVEFLIYVVCCCLLSSCLMLNDANLLPKNFLMRANSERAVIIFGVEFDGATESGMYEVSLLEYDFKNQNITGNCWNFNRLEGRVVRSVGSKKYFAFDAPSGFYVSKASNVKNTYAPYGKSDVFFAPPGVASYVGDFVYSAQESTTSIQNRIVLASNFVRENYPSLGVELAEAKVFIGAWPSLFMCSP